MLEIYPFSFLVFTSCLFRSKILLPNSSLFAGKKPIIVFFPNVILIVPKSSQEAMLKAELRKMERSQKREGVDMTYLKNVILKLLETGSLN